jgi:hypothetical protein
MSYRIKITLPDPTMDQLEALAEQRGEPASRVAAQLICAEIMAGSDPKRTHLPTLAPAPKEETDPDRRAPWIEPYYDRQDWRAVMWGSIVALHGRYPKALEHLKEGWWEDAAHVETLCALVVWRDWIDQAADDPRHELAFQTQLGDYSHMLRQEGGGVTQAWQPGPPPDEWVCA